MEIKKYFKNNIYFNELKWEKFPLILFLIVISTIIFPDVYYLVTNKVIIEPLKIDKIVSTISLDIFFAFWFIVNVFYWGNNFRRKLFPCVNSLVLILIFISWYCILFRCTSRVNLVAFHYASFLSYSDILLLSFLSFITKFKYYSNKDTSQQVYGFLEDQFRIGENSDKLGREKYAHSIASHLLLTKNPKSAFVVSIISPWGYGKSGFLNMIEEFLIGVGKGKGNTLYDFSNHTEIDFSDKYFEPVIIVKYNPWKNFDNKKLIEDFFSELSNGLKDYDNHVAKNIKKYAASLTKLSDSTLKKILEVSIENFYEESSLTKNYDQINDAFKRIGRKIIIFIDDLDRLTGEELIDVIKLVRNTANFQNVFFILAYDHNYVLNTIYKRSLISNREEYLQKIVQLEINLPPINKNVLIDILFQQLSDFVQAQKKNEIESIFIGMTNFSISVINIPSNPEIEKDNEDLLDMLSNQNTGNGNLFYRVFKNVRDVVRFINSFKLSYELIGNSIDIHDLIFLEILKMKFLSVFQLISTTAFLTIKAGKYNFKEADFDTYFNEARCSILNVKHSDLPIINAILIKIFNSNRVRFFRSVVYPKYFDFYFTYQIPNINSLENIETALVIGDPAIEKLIDETIEKGSDYDLRNYLESQTDFANKEDFQNVLVAWFYISKYDNKIQYSTYLQINALIRNKDLLDKLYPTDKNEFIKFLRDILRDEKYDPFTQAEIAGGDLNRLVENEVTLAKEDLIEVTINDKIFLQTVLANCLERVIELKQGFDWFVNGVYLKNIETIDSGTRKVKMTAKANKIMFTGIWKYPKSYFSKLFIRYAYMPPRDEFVFDPFILDYFKNAEQLNQFLQSSELFDSFNNNEEDLFFYKIVLFYFSIFNIEDGKPIKIVNNHELDVIRKFIEPK